MRRTIVVSLLALGLLLSPARAGGDIFRDQVMTSRLNITTATVVKAAPGILVSFAVTVAGSGAGTINDATTTGGASAANTIAATPTTTVGAFYLPFPYLNGLVVVPGTGQTITVSYQ